jgi:PAS domain S-box-containing protein
MSNYLSSFQPDNASRQRETASPMRALQALARQEENNFWELLASVFHNLKQGIILADRSGRVVMFNHAAEKIMGYRAGEVVGHLALWDFCEERNRYPLFRESLLLGTNFPEEEVEICGKSQQYGSFNVKVTPLYGQSGALKGAMATLPDVEELRIRERERRNLERLASIGRIISAVAHEINNPLQTVRTSLELGLDPRKTPARRREYLETADHEICRISRVIGQMRDFYNPNPGLRRPTNVNAIVREALIFLERQIKQIGVQVTLDLAPDLPTVSLIDYQLKQVFLNLILNALEMMPQGGQLVVSTWVDAEAGNVLVAFRDSAQPLPPSYAADLFNPFAAIDRDGELALGLSVSREIVNEMGGSIEIQPADGNTLIVHLPY